MNYPQKVDSILGKKGAEQMVKWIIFNEEVSPTLPAPNAYRLPDWVEIESKLSVVYPTMAKKTTLFARWFYYSMLHNWENLTSAINETLAIDSNNFTLQQLNQFAWQIFQNSNNINSLKSALAWSKKSFEKDNNYQFINTYANLLMKVGKKQEAVDWETRLVAFAKENNDPQLTEYESTLNTMKVKQKTIEQSWQGDREQ